MNQSTVNGEGLVNGQTNDDLPGNDRRPPWERLSRSEMMARTVCRVSITHPLANTTPNQTPDDTTANNEDQATLDTTKQDYTEPRRKIWLQNQLDYLYQNVPQHNPKHLGRFALDKYHPHDFTD